MVMFSSDLVEMSMKPNINYFRLWICRITQHRRLGGAQLGNRFVSFVRAYARSGCLVELDRNVCWLPFSLFPCCPGELSRFPFGDDELSLFPSPTSQTSYPNLVGLIGIVVASTFQTTENTFECFLCHQ